jgi:putative lipase involved disintegration of autophagic bodies
MTDDDDDLSAETLATDISNVIMKLYEDALIPSKIILMGHSLGGGKRQFAYSFLLNYGIIHFIYFH